jgi:hypothetical protein
LIGENEMSENLNLGQVIGSSELDYNDFLKSEIGRESVYAIHRLQEAKKHYSQIAETLLYRKDHDGVWNVNEIVRSIDKMISVTREHLNYR